MCPKCGVQQRQEKARSFRPSQSTFGARLQPRVVAIEDDVEPLGAADIATNADDSDDEAPDNIADDDDEVDRDLAQPVD